MVAARLERRSSAAAAAARDRLLGLGKRKGALDAAGYTVLGQAHDRLGEYDEAFDAFAQAKQCTRDDLGNEASLRQDTFLDHVRTFRTWYSAEKAADWQEPTTSPDQPKPIFFVGFPRSGTTLFEQMLDSHPNLVTTGETQILGRLQLITPSLLKRTGQSPHILDDLDATEVAALGRWYLAEVARHSGVEATKMRVVDKMPLNIVELGFVRRIFPSTPVIVALRDPRDVILSCFMQNFRANQAMAHFLSIEGTARLYAAVMELWLHYRSDAGLNAIANTATRTWWRTLRAQRGESSNSSASPGTKPCCNTRAAPASASSARRATPTCRHPFTTAASGAGATMPGNWPRHSPLWRPSCANSAIARNEPGEPSG